MEIVEIYGERCGNKSLHPSVPFICLLSVSDILKDKAGDLPEDARSCLQVRLGLQISATLVSLERSAYLGYLVSRVNPASANINIIITVRSASVSCTLQRGRKSLCLPSRELFIVLYSYAFSIMASHNVPHFMCETCCTLTWRFAPQQ